MKNTFIRYWILLLSALTTLHYCTLGIVTIFLGLGSHQRTDRYFRAWAKRILEIIKLEYQIVNPYQVQFIPNKNYVVMCNHASLYDIPLSAIAIDGSLRMVAKIELSRIPIFGYALKKNDFIFIDRNNRQQAMKDLADAAEKMHSGIIIWFAPEGTRSPDGSLLPFKKGGFIIALETGATIVPIGIRGAKDIVEHKTFNIKRGQRAEVHIGKPIDASQYTVEQRDKLMADVRVAIQEAAGLS